MNSKPYPVLSSAIHSPAVAHKALNPSNPSFLPSSQPASLSLQEISFLLSCPSCALLSLSAWDSWSLSPWPGSLEVLQLPEPDTGIVPHRHQQVGSEGAPPHTVHIASVGSWDAA